MPQQHIVALGGGGFSVRGDPRLDDFLLELTGRERPRICFLPTASGDSAEYVVAFYDAFRERAQPSHLELFGVPRPDPAGFLLSHDVVYVGGGNTANMLAIWRVHGIDAALREAWERGVVLAGISAGSICWFEWGVTDSFGEELAPLRCLGFLPGSNCPHYDSEVRRRPTFRRLVATEELPAGVAADDGVALHFAGSELVEAVSARAGAGAFRVEPGAGEAVETPLPVRRLD
jgi:dipeptidase E